jgi:bifunctional non-homologous end joining protein LigD
MSLDLWNENNPMRNPHFVIHEHFARTHHYDFRLEKDGVFKSWVLRKSFTHSPSIRRLAIQVDDHDLGFGSFEGEIPREGDRAKRQHLKFT